MMLDETVPELVLPPKVVQCSAPWLVPEPRRLKGWMALPLSVGPDADARLLLFATNASPRGLRMPPKPAKIA
jgi:hypothetical protein